MDDNREARSGVDEVEEEAAAADEAETSGVAFVEAAALVDVLAGMLAEEALEMEDVVSALDCMAARRGSRGGCATGAVTGGVAAGAAAVDLLSASLVAPIL